jgi:hypothetical protein
MTSYRLYRLDDIGHIVWAQDFSCASDSDALTEARYGLRASEKAEVWTGTRRVAQLVGDLSQTR